MAVPLKRYYELLGKYMLPQRWLVSGLSAGLFVTIALQLVHPQILRYFIDAAIDTSPSAPPLSALTYAALAFLSVAIALHLISLANVYLGGCIAWNATNALREDLASHCLRLDMSFHKSRTPGELIQRIDGDVGILGNYFSTFLITILGNVVLLLGILVVLFFENVMVGFVLTGCAVLMLGGVFKMRRIAVPFNIKLFQSQSELFGFIGERLSGKEDIRALAAVSFVLRQLHVLIRKVYRATLRSGYRVFLVQWTMTASFQISHAIALGLGGYLFLQGEISLGTVFMLVQYIRLLRTPLMMIAMQIQQLQLTSASIERVEELFQIENKIRDGQGANLPEGPLSVDFENVNFSYGDGENTLKDISFRVDNGKILGLLGKTGSGKTTIARMLFRFYDPQRGVVRLSGQPILDCQVSKLRSKVGLVTQDVQLFRATVRDNLTFFDPSISDGTILEAIDSLGLSTWFRSLSDGLDTRLESNSTGLSAGEAQLLAFTRAFLNKPGLVILDEASSRLDPVTEQLMEKAMDKLLENQTAIIIAHRLDTVKRVDDIMILDKGRIAEMGGRADLEKDPDSEFHRLLQMGLKEVMT